MILLYLSSWWNLNRITYTNITFFFTTAHILYNVFRFQWMYATATLLSIGWWTKEHLALWAVQTGIYKKSEIKVKSTHLLRSLPQGTGISEDYQRPRSIPIRTGETPSSWPKSRALRSTSCRCCHPSPSCPYCPSPCPRRKISGGDPPDHRPPPPPPRSSWHCEWLLFWTESKYWYFSQDRVIAADNRLIHGRITWTRGVPRCSQGVWHPVS